MKRYLLFLGLALSMPAFAQQPQTEEVNDMTTPLHLLRPAYKIPYGELTADEVKTSLDRVFAYCDAQTPHRILAADGTPVTNLKNLPEGAIVERGAFRVGSYEWGITYQALLDAARATGDQRYNDYVLSQFRLLAEAVPAFQKRDAKKEEIADPQMEQIIHPRALDDCGTMCTAMMKAKAVQADLQLNGIIDNYFDFVHNKQMRLSAGAGDNLFARNRPQHNTIWLDDMYMGIPTLAYAGIYYQNPAYFDEAATMYKSFVHRMWVPEKNIYRHGYVEGMAQQPTYHWARANGWAILTTVELLDMLPENHPDREFLLTQFRKHVVGLCALQSSEGFWHQLLDRNDSYLETSATAIYCYCIAHAIRKGWLEGVTYGGVAQLAWHAIDSQILDDGRVAGTCVGTGMAFDPAFYYYRPVSPAAAHGYGPVIWAATEMYQLLQEWHPRTNDSGLHFYAQPQTNPSPLFYVTEDGQGEAVK